MKSKGFRLVLVLVVLVAGFLFILVGRALFRARDRREAGYQYDYLSRQMSSLHSRLVRFHEYKNHELRPDEIDELCAPIAGVLEHNGLAREVQYADGDYEIVVWPTSAKSRLMVDQRRQSIEFLRFNGSGFTRAEVRLADEFPTSRPSMLPWTR